MYTYIYMSVYIYIFVLAFCYTYIYVHTYICTYIYIYIYMDICMYVCMHTFQGVVRPCRGQSTFPALSEPDCASGRWVLPACCCGRSKIGPPMAAPGKYQPCIGTVTV